MIFQKAVLVSGFAISRKTYCAVVSIR